MDPEKQSWLSRLKGGLSRSTSQLTEGVTGIFTKRKLDRLMLDELEELLIAADLGVQAAAKIVERFGEGRFDKEIAPEEVRAALAGQMAAILSPVAKPVTIDAANRPHVVLVVGVNGNGKTTTMGKMALQLASGGYRVSMAAADTFRAAAVNQLRVWGERAGVPVVSGPEGSDPASVAYQALEKARADNTDVLLIDTAGRLHNQNNLMQELEKIVRVMKKLDPSAPHTVLQVLDGTTGQNAMTQVETFRKLIGVTGLVVTKLDGSARGGVVVALAERFGLPIHAIGVGEGIGDLRDFDAGEFSRSLAGA